MRFAGCILHNRPWRAGHASPLPCLPHPLPSCVVPSLVLSSSISYSVPSVLYWLPRRYETEACTRVRGMNLPGPSRIRSCYRVGSKNDAIGSRMAFSLGRHLLDSSLQTRSFDGTKMSLDTTGFHVGDAHHEVGCASTHRQ